MGKIRACRVCKVKFEVSFLDETGRCRSCAAAKAATDQGMTYGKMQGKLHESEMKVKYEIQKLQTEQTQRRELMTRSCRNCGGMIPKSAKADGEFCCRECRTEFEKREEEVKERGAINMNAVKNKLPVKKTCVRCGKMSGRKKFCSELCKRLYKLEQEDDEEEAARKYERVCVWFGKSFTGGKISKYCSKECQAAHRNTVRRAKRAAKKAGGDSDAGKDAIQDSEE